MGRLKKLRNRIQRGCLDRWRGLRVTTTGDGWTVDQAGWYQIRCSMLMYRNDHAEFQGCALQQTIYCNAGDHLYPGTISTMMATMLRSEEQRP
jgi:hypothetical protein